MTSNTHPDETDASLADHLEFKSEPFAVGIEDLHGLDTQRSRLRDAFLPSLTLPDPPVRLPAVLLHGPAGAGKPRVARALTTDLVNHGFTHATYSPTDSEPQLRDGHRPGSEDAIAKLLDDIRAQAPAVLILEDFERVHLQTDGAFHEAIRRIRASSEQVAVICLLTRTEPRFDRTHAGEYFEFADLSLSIPAPDGPRATAVLHDHLIQIADYTAATVDADVASALATASEASRQQLETVARRAVSLAQARPTATPTITTDDVATAVQQVDTELANATAEQADPETEFEATVPAVSFDEIGGLDGVIQRLTDLVTYPQRYPDLYANTPLDPANGVLLHGPPGTGKTLVAKAVAGETDRAFYAVEGAAVKSKWFGESETRVRELFEAARANAPSLIFFDEFDAIAPPRDSTAHSAVASIVNTLLAELDGLPDAEDVLVVGATNRPNAIDPAITRPGRIGETIEVGPPDAAGQREIYQIHLQELPTTDAVTPAWCESQTPQEVTGADIAAIVERAMQYALRADDDTSPPPAIDQHHLHRAIQTCTAEDTDSGRGYH